MQTHFKNSIQKNQSVFFAVCAVLSLMFLAFTFFTENVQAQANPQINYQGKLTNASGVAVPNGTYNMRFWLISSSTAATSSATWTEALTGANKVQVTNGLFSVMLGSTTALTSVNFNQTLYLGVEIGGTSTPAWDGEMSPRKILGTVPAAFVANYSTTAGSASSSDNALALGGVASSSFLRSDEADTMTATSSGTLISFIQNGAGAIARFFSGVTEVFTILGNGNVGIGTTTPSAKLSVVGDARITGTSTLASTTISTLSLGTALSAVNGGTGLNTVTQNQLLIGGAGNTWTQVATSALGLGNGTFLGLSDTDPASYTANRLFFTNSGGTGITDSASLVFDGTNFGIGSTTPSARLTIVGNAGTANTLTIASSTGSTTLAMLANGDLELPGQLVSQGINWTARNVPSAKFWRSVTYGNGLFVAVNDSNSATSAVMTSPDGITWTDRNVTSARSWTSVTYGNGLFVAVNETGSATAAVMTSSDGITWTDRNVTSARNWQSVTYGNGLFVAVNSNLSATAAVMTSPDGITWTDRNVTSAKFWQSVTYGNGLFVAVNADGLATAAVMTSPDGITWTDRNVTSAKFWQSVTYGNGLFVAVNLDNSATAAVMTSPDGITWTDRNVTSAKVWKSVTYGNGLFVAVNQSASATAAVMTSPDGIIWTDRNVTSAKWWLSVTYGNGLFVAVNNNNSATSAVMTSGKSEFNQIATNNIFQGGTSFMGGLRAGTTSSAVASIFLQSQAGINPFAIASSTGVSMLTLTQAGRLGLGTTTPTDTLTVVGTAGTNPFTVASSTGASLFSILQNGNVGIGSTTPAFNLGVAGTLGVTGNTSLINASTTALTVSSNLFLAGALRDGAYASGTSGMVLQTTGTSTRWVATSTLGLAATLTGGTNGLLARWTSPSTLGTGLFMDNGTVSGVNATSSSYTFNVQAGAGVNPFNVASSSGTSLLTVLGNGNVGIGSTTSSARLTVQGIAGTGDIFTISSSTGNSIFRVNADGTVMVTGQAVSGNIVAPTLFSVNGGTQDALVAGGINLSAGHSSRSGSFGGPVNITSGNGVSYGGDVSMLAGIGDLIGGDISLIGGAGVADTLGLGGSVSLLAGDGNRNGGSVVITAGNSTSSASGDGGNITLTAGSVFNPSGPLAGNINLNPGGGTATGSINLAPTYGNVGIGSSTPSSKLTIVGDTYMNGSLTLTGALKDSTNASGTAGMVLQTTGTSTRWVATSTLGLAATLTGGTNGLLARWTSPSTLGTGLFMDNGTVSGVNATSSSYTFNVQAGAGVNPFNVASSSGTSVFSILANGNVGIGSSTPGRLLSVTGTSSMRDILPEGNYTNNISPYSLGSSGARWSNVWSEFVNVGTSTWSIAGRGAGVDRFAIFDGASGTGNERFTISNTGNVGIGSTSPSARLTIQGTAGTANTLTIASSTGSTTLAMLANGDMELGGQLISAGINWTDRNVTSAKFWTSVTYGNGLFVAVNDSNSATAAVMTSPDGITWTNRNVTSAKQWTSVTYGNGLFVAVNDSFSATAAVMTSPDGITWTDRNVSSAKTWRSVTYGNGLFVAVNNSNSATAAVMTSPDGITWTDRNVTSAKTWRSVTYGNGLFVAVNATGLATAAVMTSPDGITWTDRNVTSAKAWYSVTYGNGLFVAVNGNSSSTAAVMTSPDGITWTDRNVTSAKQWYGVTYGNGLFVAVNNSNSATAAVMTSPDGITWTDRNVTSAKAWKSVTYGNGLFVAVNDSNSATAAVMTSGKTEFNQIATNNIFQGGTSFMGGLRAGTTSSAVASIFLQSQAGINPFAIASSTGASMLTLTQAGNLGLGTTTPDSMLTVAGNTYIGGNLTATGIAALTSLTAQNATTTNLAISGNLFDTTNSAGTSGMVLQTTGTSTRWVATSSLGISGASTFLSLTDTPSSYTANRILFTNAGANALTDSANFTFDGTNFRVAGNSEVTGTSTANNIIASSTIRIVGGTSFPTTANEGTLFYSTASTSLYVYEQGKWQADRTTASFIVAAFNTQNKEKADYVATGTADQNVIEQALAALPSTGGLVYLLPGTYNISDEINITQASTTLMGSGVSTLLRISTGSTGTWDVIDVASTNGLTLTGFAIDGSGASSGVQNGIAFTTVSTSTISDITVRRMRNDGINLTTSSHGNKIMNTETNFNTGNGIMLTSTSNNNTIIGATAERNTADGFAFQGGSVNGTIVNSIAIGNNDGIYSSGTQGLTITGNIVSGNTQYGINSNSGSGSTTVSHNTFRSNTDSNISLSATTDSRFTNNTLIGAGNRGIYLSTSNRNVISGNSITGSLSDGVYLDQSTDNVINDNYIANNGSDGIDLFTNSDTNVISGNRIANNGAGTAASGITLDTTSDSNVITGNSITDTAGTGYAINITSATNVVSSNYYAGTGAASINDTSATTRYTQWDRLTLDTRGLGQVGYSLLSISGSSSVALASTTQLGTGKLLSLSNTSGEMFTVANSGNVGIGSSTPSSKLTIVGDTYMNGSLTLTGALKDSTNATGTLGMVLQTTGTSTRWVATSSLGISGASTFLSLTDTPSSYTANRILFTNAGANALTDSDNFTFDGTNFRVAGNSEVTGTSTANNIIASSTIRIVGGTSFPTTANEGTLFYSTASTSLYVYEQGKWQADRSTASFIVAASDTQNKEKADYVADGTDDQDTIELALAALPTHGGLVYLLPGTYNINNEINITQSSTTLMGAGPSTFLKVTATSTSWDVIDINATLITVKDIAIDGGLAVSGAQNGINFNDSDYVSIDRLSIKNMRGDGMLGPVNDSSITNNVISNNGSDGIDLDSDSASNIYISGNIIENNFVYGITAIYNGNTTITNNFISASSSGIYFFESYGSIISLNTINTFTNYGIQMGGYGFGNVIEGNRISATDAVAAIYETGNSGSIISNNYIDGTYSLAGIRLTNAGLEGILIGNKFGNFTGTKVSDSRTDTEYLQGDKIAIFGTPGSSNNLFDVSSSSGSSFFSIISNGNVGIGSSTPNAKLTVSGDSYIDGNLTATGIGSFANASVYGNFSLAGIFYDSVSSAGTSGQVLQTTGTSTRWVATSSLGIASSLTGGTNGLLARWTSPSTLSTGLFMDNGTVAGVNATSSSYTFNVQAGAGVNPFNVASSSGTSLFSILANGNVGIGSTTPSSRLSVVGAAGNSDVFTFASSTGSSLLTLTSGGRLVFGTSTNANIFLNGSSSSTPVVNSNSIAIGNQALTFTSTSSATLQNIALGYQALYGSSTDRMTGTDNFAAGYQSLLRNTTGSYNNAFGQQSLLSNTTGSYNNALGYWSLYFNTTGTSNNALGYWSLYSNTSGSQNTALGQFSLFSNTSGSNNNALGQQSLRSNTTGSYNTALGVLAGFNQTTGTSTTYLGAFTDTTNGAVSSSTAIGVGALLSVSNSMVLGGTGSNTVNIVTGTSTPWAKFSIMNNFGATSALFDIATTTSSAFATSSLFRVNANGNIGIGTSTPSSKLTIQGTAGTANTLNISSSTGATTLAMLANGDLELPGQLVSQGINWTDRNVTSAKSWTSVTYGNGLFVAVNNNNSATAAVMTSPDGITWTDRNVTSAKSWQSVTYGNGLFVAVNSSNVATAAVMTSPDGITWTDHNVPSGRTWSSVTYGNGLFVAVNGNVLATAAVMTSPDGITWTDRNVTSAKQWTSVTYGNGLFVAVNVDNSATAAVMTSPDGITWTDRNVTSAKLWRSVIYGNGLFVAVNSSGSATAAVMTSPDGITWTDRNVPSAKVWKSVTYGNGLFVAVNNSGDATAAVMTSPDGITWTDRNVTSATYWVSVTYGNGLFVAVNQDFSTAAVMTSGKTEFNQIATNNIFQGGTSFMGGLRAGTTSSAVASIFLQSQAGINPFAIASSTGASMLTLTQAGNLGLGTTTPTSLLGMERTGITGTSTAGLDQYFAFANGVASAQQYGNRTSLVTTNTATTTLVGNFLTVTDGTTFGNTVRGIEVQSDLGNNTKGENTAISGYARTFGVRGVTSGDAGGSFEPAGVYGETSGTSQGNAIRGYSSTITTAALLKLFHNASTFTGTGLLMNFGNSGGSFSSTTASRFIDLQNGGTSRFTVGAYGMLTIGDGSTTTNAGIQIGNGGLCVDNDGSCNASTTGRISSVSTAVGNSDLAEMYFSNEDLEAGEVVYLKGGLSVGRASADTKDLVLGVVSTLPGLIMGQDDVSLEEGEEAHPIALAGRVPVKLSTENGDIKAGDELMLSSLPGVAMKATSTGAVIGVALEDFNAERAYSETYVNQFGESIIVPNYVPINRVNDKRINDGCYYGGGSATGDTPCVPLKATTTVAQYDEADALAAQEAKEEALAELKAEESELVALADDREVKVGQIVMFVNLEKRTLDGRGMAMVEALLSNASSTDDEVSEETVWERLVNLANNFIDGVLSVLTLKADKVETKELCVDGVCLNADDLRGLLNQVNTPATTPSDASAGDENASDDSAGTSGDETTGAGTGSEELPADSTGTGTEGEGTTGEGSNATGTPATADESVGAEGGTGAVDNTGETGAGTTGETPTTDETTTPAEPTPDPDPAPEPTPEPAPAPETPAL